MTRRVKPAVLKWTLSVGTALAAEWAKIPYSVEVLLALMMLDYATGLVAALIFQQLSSEIAWKGLFKKFLTLIIIAVCHIIEIPLGIPVHLDQLAAITYTVYEVISILENCARCGVPVPGPVMNVLMIVPRPRRATTEEFEKLKSDQKPPA